MHAAARETLRGTDAGLYAKLEAKRHRPLRHEEALRLAQLLRVDAVRTGLHDGGRSALTSFLRTCSSPMDMHVHICGNRLIGPLQHTQPVCIFDQDSTSCSLTILLSTAARCTHNFGWL